MKKDLDIQMDVWVGRNEHPTVVVEVFNGRINCRETLEVEKIIKRQKTTQMNQSD